VGLYSEVGPPWAILGGWHSIRGGWLALSGGLTLRGELIFGSVWDIYSGVGGIIHVHVSGLGV
jgi:hypothetical protein